MRTDAEPDSDVVHGRPVVKDGRNLQVHGHDDNSEQDTSHLGKCQHTHIPSLQTMYTLLRSLHRQQGMPAIHACNLVQKAGCTGSARTSQCVKVVPEARSA